MKPDSRFNSVAKFSPNKLNQTKFLTNKGINSYLFTEGALDFSPTKRNLLLILEISHQTVGEKGPQNYNLIVVLGATRVKRCDGWMHGMKGEMSEVSEVSGQLLWCHWANCSQGPTTTKRWHITYAGKKRRTY